MPALPVLIVIAAIWGAALRIGLTWARRCGVHDFAGRLALGCIFPTAGLVFSVHILALISMFTERGWFFPEPVAILFACVAWVGRRFVGTLPDASPLPLAKSRRPRLRAGYTLPLVIVAATYAVFLVDALTRYPADHDAVYYHLPQAIMWMQTRTLNLTFGLITHSVRENGMIVPSLLAFAGFEQLFPIVHVPKVVTCALVVYALSRMLGAGRTASVVSVCIAISVPIILFQGFSDYIDLYAAASWLSALLAILWAIRLNDARTRWGMYILAGLAAGVALGSKSTYLVLVFLLVMLVVVAEWMRQRSVEPTARHGIRCVCTFALATLACSGFWFVRGVVQAGNPVYPLAVKVGDKTLLPGFTGHEGFPARSMSFKLAHWASYPWRETKYGQGYTYGVDNGLGAAYAAFVPIGLAMATFSCLTRRPRRGAEVRRVIMLGMVFCGAVLLLTVFWEILRYVLPLALLAVVLASNHVHRLITAFPRATAVLVSTSLVVTANVAAFKPVHDMLGRVRHGVWSRSDFYQIPSAVDALPTGTRILSLAKGLDAYPLVGRGLTNVVITARHWNVLADGELSDAALRRHGIDYIFTRGEPVDSRPAHLNTRLVFDGRKQQPAWVAHKAMLYKVDTALP